jgi:hypothetical protein
MTALPIPPREVKTDTWYYGVRCACARLLPLAEDAFAGNGDDPHSLAEPIEVQCPCRAIIRTQLLHKFKIPIASRAAPDTSLAPSAVDAAT